MGWLTRGKVLTIATTALIWIAATVAVLQLFGFHHPRPGAEHRLV